METPSKTWVSKIFLEWALFLAISFVFYSFVTVNLFGPCRPPFDSSINFFVMLAALCFFLLSLKYPKNIARRNKIIFTIFIIVVTLTSAILSRINTSCSRGSDPAIKANISNSRASASLYYEKNKTYLGLCTSEDGAYPSLKNAARVFSNKNQPTPGSYVYSNTGKPNSTVCHDSNDAWAAISSLKTPQTPKAGWCVDSTGASREATSLPEGITVCP